MLKSKNIKTYFIILLFIIAFSFFALAGRGFVAEASAAEDLKGEVTNQGAFLLASSDNGTDLVSANLSQVNSLTTGISNTDVYSQSGVSGSANTTVWGMSFHSAAATIVGNAISFTKPVKLSDVESITLRIFVHFSSTQGEYYTNNGGVMIAKLSEENCRKGEYSHTISRSVSQDQWIDYKISGSDLEKLTEEDGYIKGLQFASDERGSGSTNFYTGTPREKKSWLYVDYIYYTPIVRSAIDSLRDNGFLLASANYGDYEFVDKSLKTFGGYTTVPGTGGKGTPSISVVQGKTDNDGGDSTFDWNAFTEGMIGSSAFRIPFHSDNTSLFSEGIKFIQKVKASEIGGITIRMYARLSSSKTYQTTYGGIQIFGLNSEGYGTGYMIQKDIEQDKWIELVLLPEQAALLADEDGYISGLQFGAAFHSTESDLLYQGTTNQGKTQCIARLWIEYVSVAKNVDIVYKSDENEIKKSSGFIGTAIKDAFIPEKDSSVFCGWYKENGDLYDFSGVIDGETVLCAKWEDAKDASSLSGLYKTSGQGNYAKDNTYLYIDESGKIDFSDLNGVDPIVYGVTTNDEIYVINKDFSVNKLKLGSLYVKVDQADVVSVTYDFEIGSKTVKVEKGEKLKEYSVQRAGYVLTEWNNAQGNAVDFSDFIVMGDVNFAAVWEYDQISDALYEFYYGDYYCKESNTMLSLKDKNNATLKDDAEKSGEFYILKPGVIVLIFDQVKTENTLYAQRIVTVDNVTYVKLNEYIITFEVNGGSKIADVTVSDGDHKLIKPEAPAKEGYVFKYWTTVDGEEFDFDQVIMRSCTLYAVWEPNGASDQGSEDNGGEIIALIVVAGIFVVAATATLAVVIVKKNKNGKSNDFSNKNSNDKG